MPALLHNLIKNSSNVVVCWYAIIFFFFSSDIKILVALSLCKHSPSDTQLSTLHTVIPHYMFID